MNHCLNSIPTEFQYKILLKKSKTMDFKQIYVQFYVQNVKSRFPYYSNLCTQCENTDSVPQFLRKYSFNAILADNFFEGSNDVRSG